jgi:hypothetical protein
MSPTSLDSAPGLYYANYLPKRLQNFRSYRIALRESSSVTMTGLTESIPTPVRTSMLMRRWRPTLVTSFVYDLTFGKNHLLAAKGPAAAFLGRWQIAGIFKALAGFP